MGTLIEVLRQLADGVRGPLLHDLISQLEHELSQPAPDPAPAHPEGTGL